MDRRLAAFAAAVEFSIEKPAMPMPGPRMSRKERKRQLRAAERGMHSAPGGWKKFLRAGQ